MEKKIRANENIFLPGTLLESSNRAFVFCNGGLGDYINNMSSMAWVNEECPHVNGTIVVNRPFYDVAKYITKSWTNWNVITIDELKNGFDHDTMVHYPSKEKRYISAVGAHLMDLGFMFYCNLQSPPSGYGYLPQIKFDTEWKWPELNGKAFAVFTPGATHSSRIMKAKYFNQLVDYTLGLGITPVFLGKTHFSEHTDNYRAYFQNDYDLTKGVDLTNKTTLLETIQIMSRACFVLGIDNGLLHFAGCTRVPIIFGHTITSIEHRDIRRKVGMTINITVDKNDLPCIGCQSNMRYVDGHKFSDCYYGHYKCLNFIFDDGCAVWKTAIKKALMTEENFALFQSLNMNVTDLVNRSNI